MSSKYAHNNMNRYAKLCADLDKEGPEYWQYVKVIHDRANNQYYWAADIASEKELIGPMPSEQSCYEKLAVFQAGCSGSGALVRIDPNDVSLSKIVKVEDHVVQLYLSRTSKQYYFSFDDFAAVVAMAERDMAGGPYFDSIKSGLQIRGEAEAEKRGKKATSLKRLLLNKCQEAFETDDIYAEVRYCFFVYFLEFFAD